MKKYLALIFISSILCGGCNKIPKQVGYIANGDWYITDYTINGKNTMDTIDYHFPGRHFVFSQIYEQDPVNYWIRYDSLSSQRFNSYLGFNNEYKTCVISMVSSPLYNTYSDHNDYSAYIINNPFYYPPIEVCVWTVTTLSKREMIFECTFRNKDIRLCFYKK